MIEMSYNSCPRQSNYQSTKLTNSTNFSTLWTKQPIKTKDDIQLHKISKIQKTKIPHQLENNDKVIISKKQLMEFTKKFALHQVDYQEQIQFLKIDSQNKNQKIQLLQSQINYLKIQQDYLIEIIQQLRDKPSSSSSTIRNSHDSHSKSKQQQINFLQQQLTKIRTWLEQQKSQSQRCLNFIKLKDQIINKLEQQLQKYKKQSTIFSKQPNPLNSNSNPNPNNFNNYQSVNFIPQQISTQRPKINSNKKIILRRDKKQNNSKSQQKIQHKIPLLPIIPTIIPNHQYKQSQQINKLNNIVKTLKIDLVKIQDQKFQIFSKYRQMTIQNDYLRRKISDIEKSQLQTHQIQHSINNLDQVTKRIKDTQHDKQNILVAKCMFLEKQVEKLAKQLNDVRSSHVLSLSNLSSPVHSNQSNLQFQK